VIVSGGEDAPQLYDTGSQQIAEAVRIGPGPMPEFTEGQLTDTDVDDVVAYVQQLGEKQVKSEADLDQFGPIAEGAFVFAVIIPLLVGVLLVLGKRAKR
jgi:ubiquinol-cytochrome c reductase cytochrome c subunit